mmetsp:Transcript_17828/g.32235  ORF Transcript_17828/g.32235 Transcript_17828/m.32235 type:complete len:112 (+) Transcript_17828:133-468(+)
MDVSASFRTPSYVSENVDKPVRRWYVRCLLNKPHLTEDDPEAPCPVVPEALRKDNVAFPPLGDGQEVSVSRSCHASCWTTVWDVVFGEDENDDERQEEAWCGLQVSFQLLQ